MDDVGGGGEMEELGSVCPRDGGGEHRKGKKKKERMKEIQEKGLFQGITQKERLKVGERKQVALFLCCHQGIEIRRRKNLTG